MNSLALLPMRCVSITSWPIAARSAADAPCCSFSDATVSAVSSSSADCLLMVRSDWPTSVSAFCCASTIAAFLSARSTSGSSGSTASCTAAGRPGPLPSPAASARTLRVSTSALSFTSGKAAGVPIIACDTDLASRCDSISAWPTEPTCSLLREAEPSARTVDIARPSKPAPTMPKSTRCCACGRRWPIRGSAAPAAGASTTASCMRVSLKSPAISEGVTSEMIDESCDS